ncbi:hypothetical protein CI088_15995 [Enterococcus plantarum]|uniref:Uncharacterized protein n=1 Tax=Enterococcus plantarum TaxID=1077675 RepID=A0A2W4BE93_9ENTE|nr:hypothetical protein [Enterococcus plantarum]PZL70149.1 hypothetical protein CI088_15995 [Enterococcus plantarum]
MDVKKMTFHSEVPEGFANFCKPDYDKPVKNEFDIDENTHFWEYEDETLLFIQFNEDRTLIRSNKSFLMRKRSGSNGLDVTF